MNRKHEKLVRDISKQVRLFYTKNIPFRIYHGSSNSTRKVVFDRTQVVDVSDLNQVLSIDPKRKTAIVEPNVPMDQLIAQTLKHGLIPPVVMEFPGITVGGGVQGGAGESSSYKWGTFNRIVNWYEIILGNGKRVRVSRNKKADLYWGAVGSYGSLGVITLLELQLLQARRFVHVEYISVKSFQEAADLLKTKIKDNPDFIDGIMFSKKSGVIVVGNLSDDSLGKIQTFTQGRDEWFYLHALKKIRISSTTVESIPLKDYLFRYDRGAFWMGALAFQRFNMPFNRLTRWILHPLLTTRRMYTALHASNASQEYIVQDLALPLKTAVSFLKYIDRKFNIYPLWLCPLLPDYKSPLLSSFLSTPLVINIGVWGKFKGNYEEFVAANKDLESNLAKLGGKKWLYAHVYYDESQFWKIYGGKKRYDGLRKKYKAEKLPTVFDKVRVREKYTVHSKRGVLFALFGLSGIKIK